MINFQYSKIDKLGSEYFDIVEEFEKLLYRVTDRLGIVSREKYELNWGNIILLMASYGKMELIKKMAKENKVELPNEALENKRISLEVNLYQYIEDFIDELKLELNKQFNSSVISRLSNIYKQKCMLNEIHDLEYFFSERYTIELFIIGSEIFFVSYGFKSKIYNIDRKIKDYVLKVVVKNLRKNYSVMILEKLSIRWLPLNFWWRQINY